MGILLIRTVVLYAVIVFALRIMGKRQLGELQPSEFVVTILVSNIATLSIEDSNVPLLGSIMPIFALIICEILASLLILKFSKLRKIISGNPCIIIRNGEIDQRVMKELRWSIDDLMEQLRIGSVFDVSEVSYAIVETSGKLSVFKKYLQREATIETLNLPNNPNNDSPPMTIICDGQYVEDSLSYCKIDKSWVKSVLKQNSMASEKDVFLMTCDKNKNVYLAKRDSKGVKPA